MKKVLIIAAIAVIAACHLMHEEHTTAIISIPDILTTAASAVKKTSRLCRDVFGPAKNPGSIRGFSFTF